MAVIENTRSCKHAYQTKTLLIFITFKFENDTFAFSPLVMEMAIEEGILGAAFSTDGMRSTSGGDGKTKIEKYSNSLDCYQTSFPK